MSLARRQAERVAVRLRRGTVLGLVLAALCGMPLAHAFYPLGAFDSTGTLRFATWPLSEIDTNGDGDVVQGEGIPLLFETGDWGFTDAEIATVLQGFQTWGNVSTSYARFRYAGKTDDPLELSADITAGSVDFQNYVAFEFTGGDSTDTPALPAGTLGFAFISFALEDTVLTIGANTYPISGGQVIETDYVLDGNTYRDTTSQVPKFFSLQGVSTTIAGFGLGLSQSALVNAADAIYDPADATSVIGAYENRVVALPNASGVLQLMGTTSSMQSQLAILYANDKSDSRKDLAPDDIAGISFLYPRASQANFAEIQQEARTRSRLGAPSGILEGAHIVAWCDVDNDEKTLPVPFADTLTGLYELNAARRGYFDLKGLFKQLQLVDGTLFEPTYILTCAPFDPLAGDAQSNYDSTNGGPFIQGANPLSFATLFSAEVFNQFGNLLGLDNMPGGTPLRFDSLRNRFVSADTALTIPQMLPGRKPMFGDADSTCPYLVVVGDTIAKTGATTKGAEFLRNLRDNYMMQSGPGLMLVDAYYRAAPAVSGFLRSHSWAAAVASAAAWSLEWSLDHRYAFALLPLLLPAVLWLGRRRPRAARAAAATLVLLLMLLPTAPASGQELPMPTKKLVSLSKDIVTGQVTSAESRFDEKNRIVTDVTVDIGDTLKGRLNKGGKVSFKVLGGRVGAIVTYSQALPVFKKGEDVVLFLTSQPNGETTVTAGRRGKLSVETDPKTKEKVVVTPSPVAAPEPLYKESAPKSVATPSATRQKTKDAQATTPPALQEQRVPLAEYKDHLRQLVREEGASR